MSKEQIDFYQENGYLMIEDALSDEQLHLLQSVTQTMIEASREVSQSNDIYDLDQGHSAAEPRLTRIKLPHQQHPAFWDVLRSERITSMLKPLVGPDIRLHTSKLNTKAPGGGAAVEWHQDWAFYPHTNDDLLAVGIMLGDVEMDNGPLLVIPGSHRGPVLSHMNNGVFSGAIDPDDPAFDVSKAVALTGKAGSMSVHHVRTLHGSAPNLSNKARLLLLYECGAADAWPIAGSVSAFTGMSQTGFWQALNERTICGEQPLQPRLADVPIRMPLPPPPDSSSIFKVQQSSGARSAFA
ncbi:phytanoyl-CoA dioxygenase family protein [Granulosicoccus sp. 3-233]|uniref:phytanoyl-CoA dioxygenase family protein n=1 Tax=Granulosicoccus sp. 3-233 TaxID=3417969 RepID=UPI003D33CE39